MNRIEINGHNSLKRIKGYKEILTKLTLGKELNFKEQSFILSCAIVLSKYYEKDKRLTSYIELAYYIILKYSVSYKNYEPLYDFSMNFGFYPIAKKIVDLNLHNSLNLNDFLIHQNISEFFHKGYTETIEQNKIRKKLLEDDFNETCLVAPTSFGKSTFIEDYLTKLDSNFPKIAIIVPTKSLLMQTYRMIKKLNLKRKIIIHDEMFENETQFIAIFTQERTLRLLERKKTFFDLIFVDEAHNIFNKDQRNILLVRAIRNSKLVNPNLKIIYLSPLISNVENLLIADNQFIEEQRISFNIKEPEIFEYKVNKEIFKYNRFLNEQIKIGESDDLFSYIQENIYDKNFVYLRHPRKIEEFSIQFSETLPDVTPNKELQEIIEILSKYIHEEFYEIDLIKKGIVYLHGKLPNLIKEYLEYKFKNIKGIKFVIANSVILEGMNLPINTLFILNTHSLGKKELTNLIGRVNRLNEIFQPEENRLNYLLPNIHFVNSDYFNRVNGNMFNKIKQLRSRDYTDKISNPLLKEFNIENEPNKEKVELIIKEESFIQEEHSEKNMQIKAYLIKEGFNSFYKNVDTASNDIYESFNSIDSSFQSQRLLDKISDCFVCNPENVADPEIKRLKNIEARNFYEFHIKTMHQNSLKENILLTFQYFLKKKERLDPILYIGDSYGEFSYPTDDYPNPKEVYINLMGKEPKQLINLAVVKLEIENKFISYKLNKLITMLYDFNIIEEDEYNLYIYGTNNKEKLNLTKIGLSLNLISKLEADNQIENIFLDEYNNLVVTKEFEKFLDSIDDFYRYEIIRNL